MRPPPTDPPAIDRAPVDLAPGADPRRLDRALGAFVVLGLALRLFRYALNYPLWGDEAFVAVNFLDRDYLGLLRPLEYGQICPPLFLWAELAAVRRFGFSEWSLRLFPLACSLASVLLFRYAAGLVLRGVPLLMAVGTFAVAIHPIRHGAEVKPYASDLLAALVLLTLAFRWWREPGRAGRAWALVAAAPIALATSHPAVFVAGGIGLALAPTAWRARGVGVRLAFGAYLLAVAGTFLGLFLGLTRTQDAVLPGLRDYWAASFPPLGSAWGLIRWLVAVHTGSMFAYPGGGRLGASTPAFLLFAAGAVALWRADRRAILAACLLPFGLTMVAAALRRYPYGGEARIAQFLAPAICLLVGLGAARLLAMIPDPRPRARATVMATVALVAAGVGPAAADLAHPYRMVYDHRAREFARRFWPEQARDAEVACLRRDFGIFDHDGPNLRTSVYLCNQAIYAPRGARSPISATHPLRCVLPHETRADDPEVVAWLAGMGRRFDLRRQETIVVDMDRPGAPPRRERVVVFEFVPRSGGLATAPYAATPGFPARHPGNLSPWTTDSVWPGQSLRAPERRDRGALPRLRETDRGTKTLPRPHGSRPPSQSQILKMLPMGDLATAPMPGARP